MPVSRNGRPSQQRLILILRYKVDSTVVTPGLGAVLLETYSKTSDNAGQKAISTTEIIKNTKKGKVDR